MSTKTIALDSRVYDRLASIKMEGESFSKVIDRLLTEVRAAHSGGDVLDGLRNVPALPEADAKTFLEAVAKNRDGEDWKLRDLR